MKTALIVVGVIGGTIIYIVGMQALGVPNAVANVLLLVLYFAGLGWAVRSS